MKIIINKSQISLNPEQFLRRVGYGYIRDRRTGSESFVRRLGQGFYPRLHMYIKKDDDKIIFNLHLDQKQPSYAGVPAHNAEYDGEVVGTEIERLKGLIQGTADSADRTGVDESDLLEKIKPGEYNKNVKKLEKKSWWKRLFKI